MRIDEFLVARIDEDQERAAFVKRQQDAEYAAQVVAEPWMLSWHDEYDLLCIEPQRALAECDAKRRLIERCSAVGALMPSEHLAQGVLRLLALPFSDHPDFDPAWAVDEENLCEWTG